MMLVDRAPNPFAQCASFEDAEPEPQKQPAIVPPPEPTETPEQTRERQKKHSPKTIAYALEMFDRVQRGEMKLERGR